ncbi:MAG TPA: hypothetical protein VMV37_07095 [Gammaproteobacteria bacterium]|nr:hypothetical protein [Gammaproteobacteria bacterium]
MKTFPRKNQPVLAYVLGFGLFALTGQASAACLSGITEGVLPDKSSTPSDKPLRPSSAATSAPFVQAVYRPDQASAPKFLPAGDWNDNDGDEPIVGLWQFVLNGGMDFGTQAWHADGTEVMLSAARDPAQGDVCQGVWRKIGNRTYTLNHIAMGWDAGYGPGKPLIRVHLHMVVKVDRSGKSFSGSVRGVVCPETDMTQPFQEKVGCSPLPDGGSIVGTWVQPD